MATPGSRSTSRATAGSSSTRPAASARGSSRCRSGKPVSGPSPQAVAQRRGRATTAAPTSTARRRDRASAGRHQRTAAAPGAFILVALLLIGGRRRHRLRRLAARPARPDDPRRRVRRRGPARGTRLGFGPRPTQTAYEYAAALGDVLPNIRPELQTVATAKVEVAYGRRTLGEERIRALRASYRRLRVGMLRLLLPAAGDAAAELRPRRDRVAATAASERP